MKSQRLTLHVSSSSVSRNGRSISSRTLRRVCRTTNRARTIMTFGEATTGALASICALPSGVVFPRRIRSVKSCCGRAVRGDQTADLFAFAVQSFVFKDRHALLMRRVAATKQIRISKSEFLNKFSNVRFRNCTNPDEKIEK